MNLSPTKTRWGQKSFFLNGLGEQRKVVGGMKEKENFRAGKLIGAIRKEKERGVEWGSESQATILRLKVE